MKTKSVLKSKTLWFFGVVAVASAFRLLTGEDLSVGASDQSATIAEALAVSGVILRFLTNSAVADK